MPQAPVSEPGTIAALRNRSTSPYGLLLAVVMIPTTILLLCLPWYLLLVIATHVRHLLVAW